MAIARQTVFDIGMHTGQDTVHYLESGFKVVAVEANPLLVDDARVKFAKEISAGNLIVLNVGVSNRRGIMPFYINKRLSEWSSFDPDLGMRRGSDYEIMNIECVTTTDLLRDYGVPYYLKVDIEGYDFHVINDLPSDGPRPAYVSCEASEISLLDTLHEKGYRWFKLISQANNFNPLNIEQESKAYFPKFLHIRNGIQLRLQKIIKIKHPYSSSGPFGENTKGEWLGYDDARQTLLTFIRPEKGKPLNGISWFDIHAKL
jgi:FkbM family methyltransferase